jgi:hypothetical protein
MEVERVWRASMKLFRWVGPGRFHRYLLPRGVRSRRSRRGSGGCCITEIYGFEECNDTCFALARSFSNVNLRL